jgi:hypothetical protein
MIRTLPLDTNRLSLISTGHCTPVAEWEEQNGSRRPVPGAQAKDEAGTPLWIVDAMAAGEERAEVFGVQVASHEEPKVEQFKPLQLQGLIVKVSVGRDGKLKQYWSAERVIGNGKPAPAMAGKPEG